MIENSSNQSGIDIEQHASAAPQRQHTRLRERSKLIAERLLRAARARASSAINEGVSLPWNRFVVVGDSFAEGVGDPHPDAPGGLRGWADRVAEQLAVINPELAYANLAVRGKVINQIYREQVPACVELKPDLVAVSAGGNDVLRPGSDPDEIALKLDQLVSELHDTGATVVLFTGIDTKHAPVLRAVRGKSAIWSNNVRVTAERYDAIVVDLWALSELQDWAYWDHDRLHLNALGHHSVAAAVLNALNVPHGLEPEDPEPRIKQTWREARKEDAVWAKEHLMPWVIRRIKGVSSGDNIDPKRPTAEPLTPASEKHSS
ncbi:SGNH/GDSL hydrolase family protein [Leucobacter sp. OH1287]|uniref:SGNH/GDSL hydrolase family protein n=1 Tax=Leucobacter sp. OH1287 TaxID=2491049 RepID=UPI000F5E5AEE|nr:SGNH/GDSL hydrolase family protein [Leucobacter sp. OH1287]RRD61883.1 SGNH/GDSL hydrolase family protein [Leucobacter sp. OH1287]